MSRYFTRRSPKAHLWVEDEYYAPERSAPSLSVSEHEAADTGLLDANGDSIMPVSYTHLRAHETN